MENENSRLFPVPHCNAIFTFFLFLIFVPLSSPCRRSVFSFCSNSLKAAGRGKLSKFNAGHNGAPGIAGTTASRSGGEQLRGVGSPVFRSYANRKRIMNKVRTSHSLARPELWREFAGEHATRHSRLRRTCCDSWSWSWSWCWHSSIHF